MGCCGSCGPRLKLSEEEKAATLVEEENTLPPFAVSSSDKFFTTTPNRSMEPSSSFENPQQAGEPPHIIDNAKTTKMDQKTSKTFNQEGEERALTLSRTSTQTVVPAGSKVQISRDSESLQSPTIEKNSDHWNEDKINSKSENELSNVEIRGVDILDNESKVRSSEKTDNYSPNLTRGQSLVIVVEPHHDSSDLDDNFEIEEDWDAKMEKLKNENVLKEKRIQELLLENKTLRTSVRSKSSLFLTNRSSTNLREKINDIRKRSISMGSDRSLGVDMYESSNTALPDRELSQPLKFNSSVEEAKERREKKLGLQEHGGKTSNWTMTEFTLL